MIVSTLEPGLRTGAAGAADVALGWLRAGRRVARAVLVAVDGSAPFDRGAAMYVASPRLVEGSVTTGCVEGALVDACCDLLDGQAPRVVAYGSGDPLTGVGLLCGGRVTVLVHELDEGWSAFAAATGRAAVVTAFEGPRAGRTVALVTDDEAPGEQLPPAVDRAVRDAAGDVAPTARLVGEHGGRALVESAVPPARMVIVGAGEHAVALARAARLIGLRPVVCDPREAFTGSERLHDVAEVVVGWPGELLGRSALGPRDAVVVLSHDAKLDEPALLAALDSGAGYVGALGSRRTQDDRRLRLRAAGADETSIARIAGPCGLDLGARSPEETAVSIVAEVLAARAGRAGGRLETAGGPIRGAGT